MKMKRYNLVMTQELWNKYEKMARNQGVTVLEMFRRALNLFIMVSRPGVKLIIRDGKEEKEIVIL